MKWDNLISRSVNGYIYAYSWYLDLLCPEWDALVMNDYQAVMPLPVRSKYGMPYVYMPPFIQQLGVFSVQNTDQAMIKEFLKYLPAHYMLVDYNFNKYNPVLENKNFSQWRNHELDLIEDYNSIGKRYNTNTKRNIAKAQKIKIQLRFDSTPEPVVELFRQNRGRDLVNIEESDYQALIRLVYKARFRNQSRVFTAYNAENTLIAGAVFLMSHKRAIFLFSGMNQEGRESGAMFAIIDSFIQQHASQELIFDFEGSNDDNLSRFYKGFGAVQTQYSHLSRNKFPFPLRKLMQFIRK